MGLSARCRASETAKARGTAARLWRRAILRRLGPHAATDLPGEPGESQGLTCECPQACGGWNRAMIDVGILDHYLNLTAISLVHLSYSL